MPASIEGHRRQLEIVDEADHQNWHRARIAEQLERNPHFVLADRERRGYGVVEFTHQQLTTTLRVVDDVVQPDSGVSTLAQFVVEAGQPRLQRV